MPPEGEGELGVSKEEPPRATRRFLAANSTRGTMRSCLLYLIGVPIPFIIIIWLLTGHA